MDLKYAVVEQQNFGKLKYREKRPIHIAFGVDANFIRPMGVAMTSIIANNRKQNLVFHVFANSIEEIDIERLKLLANSESICIQLYRINPNIFQALQTTWNYTAATYNRFIVAKLLYPEIEKVIYIDADIVCKGELIELVDTDFDENIAMVVHDQGKFVAAHMRTLELKHKRYFNAGMLYIDLKAWNANQISEQAIDLLQKRKFFLLDQDALNILLDGRAKFIDRKWNEICNMEKRGSRISEDAVLVHFASRNKPWHIWCLHSEKELFIRYARESLWKDVPFSDKPRSYKEMKMMGTAKFQQGNYIEALDWYWKYWWEKKKK
jgi:lipopolysaccharide biosynthesis glycosyltransferase